MGAPPEIRLLEGEFYAGDPHRAFTWMRRHDPVYFDESGGVWGVALHQDVTEISRRPDLYCSSGSSRPDAPALPSMINLDDPLHLRRRGLVNRGFTPRRVADHEPAIRALCRELIATAAAKGRCDFVAEIAAPLPMALIGDLLGVEPAHRGMLQRWSDDLIAATSLSASQEAAERAMRAFVEYSEYNRAVVAERRARPRQDLMSVLVHAEIEGERLSDDDLLQEGLLILVGGNETTRHVITGGCEALLRNPEQGRKLVAEPKKIPGAVEEMLRWVTPIHNMNRTATRDAMLRGRKIRAGDKLLLLYPSANRDEIVFERAFEFDIEREPNPHVAFGFGAHFCLGASLARLELRVLFEELRVRLPDMHLVSDAPLRLTPSNFVHSFPSMEVEFSPRR